MGWWKAACSIRITNADFDFEHQIWSVEGYLDMIGPSGSEMIASKMFKHTWSAGSEDQRLLRKIVEEHVGVDMWEQEQMWDSLTDSQKSWRKDEMDAQRKKREAAEARDAKQKKGLEELGK